MEDWSDLLHPALRRKVGIVESPREVPLLSCSACQRMVACLHLLRQVSAGASPTDSCVCRCSASRCERSGCRRTPDPSSSDQQAFLNRTSSSGSSSSDSRSLWMLRVPDTVTLPLANKLTRIP